MTAEFGTFPVITGVGIAELPKEYEVDNERFIELALEANAPYASTLKEEEIFASAGVATRYWLEGVSVDELSIQAAKNALNMTGADAKPDLITVATSHPRTPSYAARIHAAIGAPEECRTHDLNAACAGFGIALASTFDMMNGNPDINKAVVVGVDVPTPKQHIDLMDYATAAILGGGAGAVVVERQEGARRPVGVSLSQPNLDIVGKETWEAPLKMRGGRVLMAGKLLLPKAVKMAAQKTGLTINTAAGAQDEWDQIQVDWQGVDKLVVHQASDLMLNTIGKELDVPADIFPRYGLRKYGNTSAATIPLTMYETHKRGELDGRNTVLIGCLGAGLQATAGVAEMRLPNAA